MKITFDANIIVYAPDVEAGQKHQLARVRLTRGVFSNCVITLQAMRETLHTITRKKMVSALDALAAVDAVAGLMPKVWATPVTPAATMMAVKQHGLWDAMLWAVARDAGCDIIVSEDYQDGRTVQGVTFLNPFGPVFPPTLDAALAPLPET